MESLRFAPDALGGGPTKVTWLGTAGFAITHGEHTVLIDPYLTRASLRRIALGPIRPNATLLRQHVPRADAIVLGHTHFDHALDAPAIARLTGATVYGSTSASHLCRAAGVAPDRIVDVEDRRVEADVGPFRLRFVPSVHAKLVLGRVPAAGEIDDCDAVPDHAHGYKCGAVFSVVVTVGGKTIYHLGSADLIDEQARVGNVDLALLTVAGWTKTPRFVERVRLAIDPAAVLLSHWDDFTAPLAEGAKLLPAMAVPRLVDELGRGSRGSKVGSLPLLGHVTL